MLEIFSQSFRILNMVRLVRVEPTTCRLGGGRSIQLSYNRTVSLFYQTCLKLASYRRVPPPVFWGCFRRRVSATW